MTTFWILWGIDAISALVILYFFFIGLADGSVSSFNTGIWFTLLAVVAIVLLGSLWLKNHEYLGWAKLLLLVLAIPGIIYALFVLLMLFHKGRWN